MTEVAAMVQARSFFLRSPRCRGGAETAGWSSSDDDDEHVHDQAVGGENGGGGGGGTFYVNPAAFGDAPNPRYQRGGTMNGGSAPVAVGGQEDNALDPANSNDIVSAGAGGGETEQDGNADIYFAALADRALRALDDEYVATVRAGGNPIIAGNVGISGQREEGERPSTEGYESLPEFPAPGANDESTPVASAIGMDVIDSATAPSFGSVRAVSCEGEEVIALPTSSSSTSAEPAVDLFADPPAPNNASSVRRDVPPVDSDAVLRAVSSIRLSAPSLASNLENYQPQNPQIARMAARLSVLKSHPVIPKAPLVAFRRDTAKAVEATANLSRSATLAEAVRRCIPSVFADPPPPSGGASSAVERATKTLTIHVLGCDHVECVSDEAMRSGFGPFVRWMGALSPRPLRKIALELVGPNVGEIAERRSRVDLLPSGGGGGSGGRLGLGLEEAQGTCHNVMYHKYLSSNSSSSTPDLIVAYNAGIWGYDSWVPTLEYLCQHLPRPTPVVITGYTLQEVEDDAEVVEDVLRRCHSTPRLGEGDDDSDEKGKVGRCKDDNGDQNVDDKTSKEWL